MIQVVAILTAQPGQREAVLAAFRENIPAVLAEDGCLEYTPVIDSPQAHPKAPTFGADTFLVIEKWRDMDALNAHAKAPHMAAYAAKVKDLVAARAVHVLEPAA
jgi:quinol monooxygenase YgiN